MTLAEKLRGMADWLVSKGRSLGNSFEYQGGSHIEREYREKAEEVRTIAASLQEYREWLEEAASTTSAQNCADDRHQMMTATVTGRAFARCLRKFDEVVQTG